MEPGDHGTSAASDSSGMLLQQFTCQQECDGGNQRHQKQEDGEQPQQQLPTLSHQQPLQQLLPQQHHLQQFIQNQQVLQKLQQSAQSQQQSQQNLQQSTLQPQQQHLQQLLQPQQNQQQQLSLQPQQQHSQKLPQPQHQPQQQLQQSPLPSQQQLPQSKQELQQQQLQPQGQQQRQFNHQQPLQSAVGQTTSSTRGQSASHPVSFRSLLPMILSHLSEEQAYRFHFLYTRLRRNELNKEDFLRATRNVVGDQLLVQAILQMQLKQQAQSQSTSSSQPNQQQQQHTQGSSQQFMTQQLHEPQPFQQVPAVSAQQQTQRTLDLQPHSQTSAGASVSHSSSDNKAQQLRQAGEQRSEISSVHVSQTSTMNLHQVKHDVDRTMVGFPPSIQQRQQHLQVPESPFSMYGCNPGNYSSESFSVAPGILPSEVKAPTQDSQTRQVIHPQVGVQAQGGPPQLSNTKTVPKYDLSKLPKRLEEEERQKMLQSGGTSHFSGQHQPSIWETRLDKEQLINTGIPLSTSVHVKQEVNDNSVQQHNLQNLQPTANNLSTLKGVNLDHGQSVLQKPEGVEHQIHKASSISSANISTANQPLGSTGAHSNHVMQVLCAPPVGLAEGHDGASSSGATGVPDSTVADHGRCSR